MSVFEQAARQAAKQSVFRRKSSAINIRVEPALKRRFADACRRQGLTESAAAEALYIAYCEIVESHS